MEEKKGNSTEDILRQKLEGFEMPVEDFVFEAIQAEIDSSATEKSNKRGWWFWLLIIAIIPILITAFLIFNPFKSNSSSDSDNTPAEVQVVQSSSKIIPLEESTDVPAKDAQKALKTSDSESVLNEEPSVKIASASIERTEDREVKLSALSVQTQSTDANTPTTDSDNSNRSIPAAIKDQETSPSGSGENSLGTNTLLSLEPSSPSVANSSSMESILNEERAAVTSSESSEALLESNVLQSKSVDNLVSSEAEITNPTENNTEGVKPQSELGASEEILVVDSKDREGDKRQVSRFSIQALVGGGFSYRTLSSPMNQDLETHKNDHERYGWTYSFALGGRYHFNPKLFAGIGLGFASYSERYGFQHDVITHTTANTYDYLQIPLNVGIRLHNARRVAIYGQLGVVWNSLISAQSSWVDPNSLSAVSHSNNGAGHPFQDNTFQTTLGFDVAIRLNSKWELNLVPAAAIFLNSIYLQSTNLDQKPYSGSLSLGLSRRF